MRRNWLGGGLDERCGVGESDMPPASSNIDWFRACTTPSETNCLAGRNSVGMMSAALVQLDVRPVIIAMSDSPAIGVCHEPHHSPCFHAIRDRWGRRPDRLERLACVWRKNDRVRIGFIGLGNRGDQVLSAFLDAQGLRGRGRLRHLPALPRFRLEEDRHATRSSSRDYRKLLDARKTSTRSSIATPDHWHALMMRRRLQGRARTSTVEKPLSLCVAEGRAMVKAAREHKRVVQCGIQRLSSPMSAGSRGV